MTYIGLRSVLKQTKILTLAGLKARYRNSWIGYLWVVISPITTFAVQAFVFTQIFQIRIPNYGEYLLISLLPWYFFSITVDMTTTAFFFNSRLLKSNIVQPIAIILSKVNENLISYLTTLLIGLCCLSLVSEVSILTRLLFCVLAIFPLYVFTAAVAFTISCLNTLYFDVKFISTFFLGLLFYLTPILYTEDFVPLKWQWLNQINPLTYLFRPFGDVSQVDESFIGSHILVSYVVACTSAACAYIVWKGLRNAVFTRV